MGRTLVERVATLTAPFWGESVFRSGQAAILASRAARDRFVDLWDAEVRVFSQWGEDGVLDYLCEALGLARPSAIELGAGNYLECDTRFLAEYRNAAVTVVDARGDLAKTVQRLPLWWRTTIDVRNQWITPDTVGPLMEQAKVAYGGLDVVTLDIDGNDYWVAEAMDLAGVSIVMVEYNAVFGDRPVTVPRQDGFVVADAHPSGVYFGASLAAFVDLFEKRGFAFVGANRACCNAFFVPVERIGSLSITIPEVGDLSRYTDYRYRTARDGKGRLAGLTPSQTRHLIRNLPLVDTRTGTPLRVGDVVPGGISSG